MIPGNATSNDEQQECYTRHQFHETSRHWGLNKPSKVARRRLASHASNAWRDRYTKELMLHMCGGPVAWGHQHHQVV